MTPQRTIEAFNLLQSGEITIRELKGITEEEMAAGVRASQRLLEAREHEAAAEVLAGLALYDPYYPAVWSTLEDLCRRERLPEIANFCASLARVTS
jgi:hypothetical protein